MYYKGFYGTINVLFKKSDVLSAGGFSMMTCNKKLERMISMANLVDKINEKHIRKDIPEIRVGDIVRVDVWVKEGKKERIQAFEGIVIAKKGGSVSETISVRKKSGSVGVTRIFPVNAPTIDKIVVVKKGMVRRAKLNFIKNMRKEYKVKERN